MNHANTGNANWGAAHYFGRDACYNLSEVVWMTFEIKLKTDFFRTRSYYLTIGQGRLVLTPQTTVDTINLFSSGIFNPS